MTRIARGSVAAPVEIAGGVDTHQDTHTAAVVDAAGRMLGHRTFPTTDVGYRGLLAWLGGFGTLRVIGVEGTGAYGGRTDDRPGLASCLKALRKGDRLVVWKLDRLGRNLHHLVNTVHDLTARGIGLKVLTGQGAAIDTTTAAGKLVFGIFAALAEFERELISERTIAGLASARARGRNGGRPYKMTPAKLRLATASMGQPDTKVGDLCTELGITRQTLYRHVSPTGELRPDGLKLLAEGGLAARRALERKHS